MNRINQCLITFKEFSRHIGQKVTFACQLEKREKYLRLRFSPQYEVSHIVGLHQHSNNNSRIITFLEGWLYQLFGGCNKFVTARGGNYQSL